MMASVFLCTLLAAGPAANRPAPLNRTQITTIQKLVRRTQDRNGELKAALNDRQQKLMEAYSQFELDEILISKLHKEIIDLQRELLDNYHVLQREMRDIVGKKNFLILKKRVDLVLKSKKKVQVPSEASTSSSGTGKRRSGTAKPPKRSGKRKSDSNK